MAEALFMYIAMIKLNTIDTSLKIWSVLRERVICVCI